MLTQQLRGLAREGLIRRTIYSEVPARTEYELTEYGRTLIRSWRQFTPGDVGTPGGGMIQGWELALPPQQITALAVSLKAGR